MNIFLILTIMKTKAHKYLTEELNIQSNKTLSKKSI